MLAEWPARIFIVSVPCALPTNNTIRFMTSAQRHKYRRVQSGLVGPKDGWSINSAQTNTHANTHSAALILLSPLPHLQRRHCTGAMWATEQ